MCVCVCVCVRECVCVSNNPLTPILSSDRTWAAVSCFESSIRWMERATEGSSSSCDNTVRISIRSFSQAENVLRLPEEERERDEWEREGGAMSRSRKALERRYAENERSEQYLSRHFCAFRIYNAAASEDDEVLDYRGEERKREMKKMSKQREREKEKERKRYRAISKSDLAYLFDILQNGGAHI